MRNNTSTQIFLKNFALTYSKAVLFIDYNNSQTSKYDIFLHKGMCPDDDIDISRFQESFDLLFVFFWSRTDQKLCTKSVPRKHFFQSFKVLTSQNLRRSQKNCLNRSIFFLSLRQCVDNTHRCHNGFSTPNISL